MLLKFCTCDDLLFLCHVGIIYVFLHVTALSIEMPCYHVAMLLAMFWYPTILLFVAMLFSYVNVKFLLYH